MHDRPITSVYLYHAYVNLLLYTKHNQVLQELESYMEILDYVTIGNNNVAKGGHLKKALLTHSTLTATR